MTTAKKHISFFNISKYVKKLEKCDFCSIFALSNVDSAYEKFIQQFCTIFKECLLITSVISKKKHGEL